jgi:hypothetical protein
MYPTIITDDAAARAQIITWLDIMGVDVCDVLANAGCKYIVLDPGQTFAEASPVLRRISAGVDAWPIPPAGLAIVEERTVILRSMSPMTWFHETMHLIDMTLGGGVYLSGIDPCIRRAFASATAFVTPYSASACDEFMAESCRAYWGLHSNDAHSIWPRATRERLESLDPVTYAIVCEVFEISIPYLAAAIRARRAVAA